MEPHIRVVVVVKYSISIPVSLADEMVAPKHVYCPHKYQGEERNAKLQTRQNCCSVAPNPSPPPLPPKGISSPGKDDPGHATRLVATQQPVKALHLTIPVMLSLCSIKGVQACNDKSYELKHVMLPQGLPQGTVCTKELLIFGIQILDSTPKARWKPRNEAAG